MNPNVGAHKRQVSYCRSRSDTIAFNTHSTGVDATPYPILVFVVHIGDSEVFGFLYVVAFAVLVFGACVGIVAQDHRHVFDFGLCFQGKENAAFQVIAQAFAIQLIDIQLGIAFKS